MKKRHLAIVILSFLFTFISNAQYKDFDLSLYKLPDVKFSSLDFRFNVNHSVYSYDIERNNIMQQDIYNRHFAGLFDVRFYHYRNKANYQGSQSASVSVTPDYYKTKSSDNINKNNSFDVQVSLYSENRFYNSSRNFFEVNPSLTYSLNNDNDETGSRTDKENVNSFSVSAPVSVGHGRIEPVQDARLAIYILEELSKNGKIKNTPSEAMIIDLAREISKIKNKRFFDSRIRRMEELQAVDSFLYANNIVSSDDIVYFTRLSDMWDYAAGPVRYSGFSVSAGINDYLRLLREKDETSISESVSFSDFYMTNIFGVGVFGQLQYSKPLNLYWQSDLSFNLSFDYEMNRHPSGDDGNTYDNNLHLLHPYLSYSIRYIPNSRTSIGLSLSAQYIYQYGKTKQNGAFVGDVINGTYSGNNFQPYAYFDMYYYISPQLRLQVYLSPGFSGSYQYYKFDNPSYNLNYRNSYLYNNFSLTLTYSLF
jgi:hypothetical protein